MARGGDLPGALARVSRRFAVPWVADIATAVVVVVLLVATDVLTVVGFSSVGVLLYYAIANIAAFTLTERQWYAPRWLNAVGALACLVLAFTLAGGVGAHHARGARGRARGARDRAWTSSRAGLTVLRGSGPARQPGPARGASAAAPAARPPGVRRC